MDRTLPQRQPDSPDDESYNSSSLREIVRRLRSVEQPDRAPAEVIEEELKQLRQLAWLMDESITIPKTGMKIGLDGIIGMIPGVGDVITAGISSYIIRKAYKLGVSRTTLMRMIGNTTVDVVVGVVPVVGDLFDFAWKANRRNVKLLIKHLEKRQLRERKTELNQQEPSHVTAKQS